MALTISAAVQTKLLKALKMGYRSEVSFGISKKAKTAMLLADVQFSRDTYEYAILTELEDGMTIFNWDSVKWYESFPFVQENMAVFDYLDKIEYGEEYAFIRMGEEYGDCEIRGEAGLFYPCQSIDHDY